MAPQEDIPREFTDYLASNTEGATEAGAKKGLSSRRSFLLKSAGVLGGLAVGLYVTPAMSSVSIRKAYANLSPCPTSASTSDLSTSDNPGEGDESTSSPCSSDAFRSS